MKTVQEQARAGFVRLQTGVIRRIEKLRQATNEMVGAMEKGIAAAKVSAPPAGTCDGIDLRTLPKYICFKAALLREKSTLQMLLAGAGIAFAVFFVTSRVEVAELHQALRLKEYILAPGVVDLTPVSPQTVPDSYVNHAVTDFLTQLGNINATNIDEQYAALAAFMNASLKVRFEAEAADWKARVKADGLTEAMTILSRHIEADAQGRYSITADVRTDTYIKSEYVGARDEVVQLELELVPPKDGKRWFLAITSLSRMSASAHKTRDSIQTGGKK